MPIRLVVDGEPRTLEVDLAKGEARLGGVAVPFRVVDDAGARVELELDGEKYLVEGWPPTIELEGKHTLTINRELHRVEVTQVALGAPATAAFPAKGPAAGPAAPAAAKPSAPSGGGGTPIMPPMPGKVLEVRVHEGDRVSAGDTLLVLEAMKMRNEVQSPVAGAVRDLRASPGASVKAHEVLLRVVPV